MNLKVYSIKKVLYEGEAESVNLRATDGELTILNNHRPLITSLSAGPVKVVKNDKPTETIDIPSGFLEVKPESQVTILVNA